MNTLCSKITKCVLTFTFRRETYEFFLCGQNENRNFWNTLRHRVAYFHYCYHHCYHHCYTWANKRVGKCQKLFRFSWCLGWCAIRTPENLAGSMPIHVWVQPPDRVACVIDSFAPGGFQLNFRLTIFRLILVIDGRGISWDEYYYWTLPMINQHWFRQWLGSVCQQAITCANVDWDLCRHMASLGHNESTLCGLPWRHNTKT